MSMSIYIDPNLPTGTIFATTANATTATWGSSLVTYGRPPSLSPLAAPPEVGQWIIERDRRSGTQSRKVIRIDYPERRVVCKGQRHSMIKFENLHRYALVNA